MHSLDEQALNVLTSVLTVGVSGKMNKGVKVGLIQANEGRGGEGERKYMLLVLCRPLPTLFHSLFFSLSVYSPRTPALQTSLYVVCTHVTGKSSIVYNMGSLSVCNMYVYFISQVNWHLFVCLWVRKELIINLKSS